MTRYMEQRVPVSSTSESVLQLPECFLPLSNTIGSSHGNNVCEGVRMLVREAGVSVNECNNHALTPDCCHGITHSRGAINLKSKLYPELPDMKH